MILNEDETTNRVYGTYNLRGFKSSDTNTDRFPRGTKMAIQMEKDFPEEWSFYIEYKDFPLFGYWHCCKACSCAAGRCS